MEYTILFIEMLFAHIVDDYYLQGKLCDLKQKKWWKDNVENFWFYENDYKFALFVHGFSWSFVVMIPIYIFMNGNITVPILIAFLANAVIHAIIDNEKANNFRFNLIQDQVFHIVQIFMVFVIVIIFE